MASKHLWAQCTFKGDRRSLEYAWPAVYLDVELHVIRARSQVRIGTIENAARAIWIGMQAALVAHASVASDKAIDVLLYGGDDETAANP